MDTNDPLTALLVPHRCEPDACTRWAEHHLDAVLDAYGYLYERSSEPDREAAERLRDDRITNPVGAVADIE